MSSHLEQFIKDHRDEFDSEEPAKKVWDEVKLQLEPGAKQETTVIRFNFFRWSTAAAVVVLLGSGIWYFSRNTNTSSIAKKITNELPAMDSPAVKQPSVAKITDSPSTKVAREIVKPKEQPKKVEEKDDMSDYKQETYYYTKLIEIKHNELKKLEKDEPLLYKKFSGDSNWHRL